MSRRSPAQLSPRSSRTAMEGGISLATAGQLLIAVGVGWRWLCGSLCTEVGERGAVVVRAQFDNGVTGFDVLVIRVIWVFLGYHGAGPVAWPPVDLCH